MNNKNSRFSVLIEDNKKKDENNNKKKDENNNKKKDEKIVPETKIKEETKEEKKPNIFKNNPEYSTNTNSFKNSYEPRTNMFNNKSTILDDIRKKEEESRLKYEKEEKERKMLELEKSLNDNTSFPELISNKKEEKNKISNNTSFIETLNKVVKKEIAEKNNNYVKPGWVSITYNKNSNSSIFSYGKKINNEKIEEKVEEPEFYSIIEILTNNYYTWKNEYIQKWGEDEYEKMFISPNYDYEYFDKLDEKYEKELEAIEDYNVYDE